MGKGFYFFYKRKTYIFRLYSFCFVFFLFFQNHFTEGRNNIENNIKKDRIKEKKEFQNFLKKYNLHNWEERLKVKGRNVAFSLDYEIFTKDTEKYKQFEKHYIGLDYYSNFCSSYYAMKKSLYGYGIGFKFGFSNRDKWSVEVIKILLSFFFSYYRFFKEFITEDSICISHYGALIKIRGFSLLPCLSLQLFCCLKGFITFRLNIQVAFFIFDLLHIFGIKNRETKDYIIEANCVFF